ncbi:MAG: photosynthetic complex putative assembly protein PuhB [Maricaulaceae bacterium]
MHDACFDEETQTLSLKESHAMGVPHPGLPAPLPAGETMIWQGAPQWRVLSRQMFHTRLISLYFGAYALWTAASTIYDGAGLGAAVLNVVPIAVSAALVLGVLSFLAWFSAKATIYTITDRRIVMRIGAALSKTIDIPFKAIETVELRSAGGDVGSISIRLRPGNKPAPFLLLWPHVRPWRLRFPEPTLRAVPDVRAVAQTLADNLQAALRTEAALDQSRPTPAPAPPTVEPDAAEKPAAKRDDADHGIRVTGGQLIAAATLIALTVVTVTVTQLSKSGDGVRASLSATPERVYQLRVEDLGEDQFNIFNVETGEQIAFVDPRRDNLVVKAYRGLEYSRNRSPVDPSAPYQLVVWENGRVTLSDFGTDRHMPLDSFGPTYTGALAALLNVTKAGPEITGAEAAAGQ